MEEHCQNLGIDYTLSVHTFPGLLEAVSKGDIDIAMTGIQSFLRTLRDLA